MSSLLVFTESLIFFLLNPRRALSGSLSLVCSGDTMAFWACCFIKLLCVLCLVTQSCPTLCDPMDCNPPGFSVHGILQAGILESVAMPSSRGSCLPRDSLPSEPPGKPKNSRVGGLSLLQGSSRPRNRTENSCIAGGFFTKWATREAPSNRNRPLFSSSYRPWSGCQANIQISSAMFIWGTFLTHYLQSES